MNIIEAFNDIKAKPLPQSRGIDGLDYLDRVAGLQIGAGSKVFRGDQSGIWLGASKFADAPFSVDMQGNIVASTATFGQYISKAGTSQALTGDFNLNDIFSDFFGGGMSGDRREQKRGRDISTEINISFSDSIFGANRQILITKTSSCFTCHGSGAKAGYSMVSCKTCNGQGKIRESKRTIFGNISSAKICETCLGAGEVPKEVCETCKGKGVLRREEEISIIIPAGIRDGEMIRMTGYGEAVWKGTAGDLYIKINVTPHPVFKRDSNDLVMNLNLKLSEALLGAEYPIQTLDGEIQVTIPEGVSINEILRVRGKGVPTGKNKRGDLLIKLNIKLPSKLSRKSRELIEQLQKEGI